MSNSPTRDRIREKRRIKRQKRKIKLFRLLSALGVMVAGLAFMGWLLVQAYSWASYEYNYYSQMYSEYQSRKELRQEADDPSFKDYTNVLFMGLDDGREATGQQVDSLVLMSINNETGAVHFLNIPRYTLVTIPGGSAPERVNNAFYYGGIDLLEQSVENMLGVTIHEYLALDPMTMAKLIDAIDGIDVYVDVDMNYDDPDSGLSIHLKKGYQKMDGATAMKYLRFNSDSLGDMGRSKRQQGFMKTLIKKLSNPDIAPKLPEILEICQENMDSSIERFDIPKLTKLFTKVNGDKLEMDSLPGAFSADGNRSWVVNTDGWQELKEKMFPTAAPQPSEQ